MTDLPTVVRARNGELVTASNPIHRGDTIIIYLTGMGRTSPAVEDGAPAPSDPLAAVLTPPVVTLGGTELSVTFAGLTPGEVGVYQINADVSRAAPLGMQQVLEISQGSGATSVPVRVVD